MGTTKTYFAAVCILLTTMSQCLAVSSGNEILRDCQTALRFVGDAKPPKDPMEAVSYGVCAGTVRSLLNVYTLLKDEFRFCPPEVTIEQGARVLVKYLEAHPEITHQSAELLSLDAFKAAWPCH